MSVMSVLNVLSLSKDGGSRRTFRHAFGVSVPMIKE